MSEPFKSSLSAEEIEENFKDFNLFEEIKEGLNEAIEHEKKRNKQMYKLCLDDYSAASFTSFDKKYFGTIDMIETFINTIKNDEQISDKFGDLISVFDKYKNGEKNITHNVAYREVPFLSKVKLLGTANSILTDYKWEHLNTWGWPYKMRYKEAKSEHIWLSYQKKYVRCIRTQFTDLQYENTAGKYNSPGMLWGFPHQIEIANNTTFNRLYVVEKIFKNKQEALDDMASFQKKPDPIFTEVLNDIFGDG